MPNFAVSRGFRGCAISLSAALAQAIVVTPAHAGGRTAAFEAALLAPNVDSTAREFTRQGQERFDSGDYRGAAAAWRRILEVLPENDVNLEERENALLITLEAYKEAYRRMRADTAEVTEAAVDLLRQGLRIHETYAAAFERAHPGATIDPAVDESIAELKSMLATAESGLTKTPPPVPPSVVTQPIADRTPAHRGPSGTGMIVGGATLLAVGLGTTAMIVVGGIRAKQADRDLDRARQDMDEGAERDAAQQRTTANALLISGSVLTGVFVATGATLLGIGIHRRIRYTAFAPEIGPRYVGVGVKTRF